MLARGAYMQFTVCGSMLGSLSDHAALRVSLPWVLPRSANASLGSRTVYRWVEGSSLTDYSSSWVSWCKRTDTPEFADAFAAVVDSHQHDVDALATAVESFLLTEAIAWGVVTKQEIKAAANPNKLRKSLAPWFSEACREAKKAYKLAAKRFGRTSIEAKNLAKAFVNCCQSAQKSFSATLPNLLKY
jgi:hypothetical protein